MKLNVQHGSSEKTVSAISSRHTLFHGCFSVANVYLIRIRVLTGLKQASLAVSNNPLPNSQGINPDPCERSGSG